MADPLQILDAHLHARRIRARRLKDGVASLVVDATGLSDLEQRAMEEELRSTVGVIEGVESVRVAFTAEKVERTLIAVGSGKGGVGKSTLSANLAIALSSLGRKVGMIDADIYGPSQPTIFGAHDKPQARENLLVPVEAHGIRLLSVGQMVSADTALAWRGPMATSALNQLIDADWGDADTLVIDLPPGTGDVQLSLIKKARPAAAVIVSTPQDLSLIDARRAVDLFAKTGVPVLGIIENMAGYACPHCGETSDPFGQGGAEASAKSMDIPFLGRLPLSASLRAASDEGHPAALDEGPARDAFVDLAGKILDRVEAVRSQSGR
ncbi:Mrp/NBP35 family ATP-binding protein [Sphingomicrobium sp. XHP0235]|uniref:Mrp/NBP35 family ATP-binding protein n=1 Tax=Sphingomicrobium aquimarinum TaxID=3133971 RepID=UPI0031FEF85F